jgi:CubicO group peptidase (beta-lactamase class C family)
VRSASRYFLILLIVGGFGTRAWGDAPAPTSRPARCWVFGPDEPENQGIDVQKLIELTQWVKESPSPILSILISRRGKVVYQLYTSSIDPQAAHYIMSGTKSVLSALVGVAIDHKLIAGTDETMPQLLPRQWFPNDAAVAKFSGLTLKEVLGMSALDAPIAPHQTTPEAIQRNIDFFGSPNRTQYALTQNLLAVPGRDYLYTDVTCALASGAVECATHQSLFDFANLALFEPMGFQHQEWMHEDPAGIDNGAYGLRLRPIDMQKFGLLFLNQGQWNGRQLISSKWVTTSFTPWIASDSKHALHPDYGWYWWRINFGHNWNGHVAVGWKGQRIAVFPVKDVVVTMTAIIEDNTEDQIFSKVMKSFVIPAVDPSSDAPTPEPAASTPELKRQLNDLLREVYFGPSRIAPGTEERMIPSISPKQTHQPFLGQ